MRSLGLHASQDDLQEMMTEADEDGSGEIRDLLVRNFKLWTNSGSIEFEEFLNMMRRKMKENENSMDDVKAAFKVFDQNGDG